MLRILYLAALMGVPAAPTGVAPSVPIAKPKWVIDYAPSACILSRARSGMDGGLSIETRPYENDHEIIFFLPRQGSNFFKPGSLSVPDSRTQRESFVVAEEPPQGLDRLVRSSISNEQLELAQREATLGVTSPGRLDARVSVAGLGKALKALKDCEDNLAVKWGTPKSWTVDPQPLVEPNTVFRNDDYPSDMLEQGKRGQARLLFKVSASGLISDCRAIEMEGSRAFAEMTCAVIKERVKFTPARDAGGQAVPSYFVAPRVKFELAN